ncbi:peptidylprolyl isomerase [bacterium]|nr:peptidylprolyl isomerase [bacterium]
MNKWLNYLLVVVMCSLLSCGCLSEKNDTSKVSSGSIPVDEMQPNESFGAIPFDEKEDFMVADVNGTIITGLELKQEMDNIIRQFGDKISPGQMNIMRARLKEKALENLVNKTLFLQEAERQNIKPDAKSIDNEISIIASRYPTMKEFTEQLESLGISEEKLRQEIERNLKIKGLLNLEMPPLEDAKEEEINAFYRENPDNFRMPERVRASHILISVDPDDGPEKKEEKRQSLLKLRDEINNGADFMQVAQENSDCPSKSRGGDLGYFDRGKMVKPFEDAAFQLKIGELSDIVETTFGYHIIKLTDRQDAKVIPVEDARDKIISLINNQKKGQAINDYLLKLRSSAKINYSQGVNP